MKRTSRWISRAGRLAPAAALLATALLAAPGAARALTLSLSATSGSDVTVTVTVSGVESLAEPSLGAYDLDLTFDDSVLAFSDVDFGPFLGGPADSFQSFGVAGDVVDFAEVSLVFPNVLLQDLQPDTFVLATLTFDVLVTEETLTSVALSQTVVSDGGGAAVVVDPVSAVELQAAIPEASGVHVFSLGLLLALGGHGLALARARRAAASRAGRTSARTGS